MTVTVEKKYYLTTSSSFELDGERQNVELFRAPINYCYKCMVELPSLKFKTKTKSAVLPDLGCQNPDRSIFFYLINTK